MDYNLSAGCDDVTCRTRPPREGCNDVTCLGGPLSRDSSTTSILMSTDNVDNFGINVLSLSDGNDSTDLRLADESEAILDPINLLQGHESHRLPYESQAVLIFFYTAATSLSVCGNIVAIVVLSIGKRSKTDLRGFLINLAVADLIMAIFCMPFTFTMTMLGSWIFSEPMCPIVLYMQTVSVTASVGTNMAIGVDRFFVVTFPLKSRITKSRIKVVIAAIWVLAVSLSSVQLAVGRAVAVPGDRIDCIEIWPEPSHVWRRVYTFFILTLTYLMPLSILASTYGFLARKLWKRITPGNADETRNAVQVKSKRKVG